MSKESGRSDRAGMAGLEHAIERASAELRRLRGENADLQRRLGELEAAAARPADKGAAAWERERDEVRRSVERLVAGLEELLQE